MKQVEMTMREFLNFRIEAKEHHVDYLCQILTTSSYSVEADADFLTFLGF